MIKNKKLLVILGATSTGKTDLALYFAKKLNGEIISADSRQVYKYLDIGTGKMPSEETVVKKGDRFWEIDNIKVRLYDSVDPKYRFNLYEYITEAQDSINEIVISEKLPILTGGTGLYIRSLLEGVADFGAEENPELRKELEELSFSEIANKILLRDAEAYRKINESDIKNKRRLIRIYEKLNNPQEGKKSYIGIESDFDVLKIGLTADIEVLRKRIKARVLARINQGMIEESINLLAKGVLSYERMDQLGLEYRYIAKYLKGEIKTEEDLIEILSLKIGQFAKRQMTWFKKEKEVFWFDITKYDFLDKVAHEVLNWYNIDNEPKD